MADDFNEEIEEQPHQEQIETAHVSEDGEQSSTAGGFGDLQRRIKEAEIALGLVDELVADAKKKQTDLNAISASIETIKDGADTLLSEINLAAEEAEISKKSVQTSTASASKELGKIEELRKQVEEHSRATASLHTSAEDAKNILTQANTTLTEAEKLFATAQASVQTINSHQVQASELLAQVTNVRTSIDAELKQAAATKATIEDHSKVTEDLAEKAAQTEATIAKLEQELQKARTFYEERLAEINGDYDKLFKKIEGLLPGATSAHLASSFKTRTEHYDVPRKTADRAFYGCIVALLLLAFINPVALEIQVPSLANIWNYLLSRFAFVLPLVWLAVVMRRQSNFYLRLQEEYAHKETISKSFEGYKTQFADILSEDGRQTALNELGSCVVETLGRNPSKIFESKHEQVAFVQARKLLDKVVETASKLDPKKLLA